MAAITAACLASNATVGAGENPAARHPSALMIDAEKKHICVWLCVHSYVRTRLSPTDLVPLCCDIIRAVFSLCQTDAWKVQNV